MAKKNIVEEYRGTSTAAQKLFLKDAEKKARNGYFPISQTYQPGAYGCGSFLVALLLCFIIIGFLIFIYMLIVKPAGTLTVTYEYREATPEIETSEEKVCPECAETIKVAAIKCRYCGYLYEQE